MRMQTGESDSVNAAERGKASLEVWLIPLAALAVLLLVSWLMKPAIEQLLASAAVQQCDTMLLQWFRSRATPVLDGTFQSLTLLASPFAMIVYAFLGLSMLVKQRQWLLLFCWDAMFLGMWGLNNTVKVLYYRPRPVDAEQFLHSTSFGFPSGHALSAIAGFGMMAFAWAEATEMERESRAVLWIFAVALMLVIGTSRLYLGVHYLSDVLAGFLYGGLWLVVCLYAYQRAKVRYRQANQSRTSRL